MKKLTKKEKAKNLWQKIRKPLMICSFVFNGLFILITIIGCSMPKADDQSNNSNSLVKRNYLSSSEVTDLTGTQWHWNTSQALNFNSQQNYYIDFSSGGANFYVRMQFNYTSSSSKNLKYWTANSSSITAYSYNGSSNWQNGTYTHFSITGGNDVQNLNLISLLQQNAILDYMPPINTSTSIQPTSEISLDNDITQIVLNDSFLPTAYVAKNGEFYLNGWGAYSDGQPFLTFTGLTFESNGQIFNRIWIAFMNYPTYTDDGTSYKELPASLKCVSLVVMKYEYYNSSTDEIEYSVNVLTPRKSIVTMGGAPINIPDVRPNFLIWANENYRTLNILENTNEIQTNEYLVIENMTTLQLLQVTSNVANSATGVANITDVIRTGFSAFNDIFKINILPGITIGLLLFLPLVVGIILAVLKLIKK